MHIQCHRKWTNGAVVFYLLVGWRGGGGASSLLVGDMWYINVTVKRVLDFQYSFSVITIFFLLLIYYN